MILTAALVWAASSTQTVSLDRSTLIRRVSQLHPKVAAAQSEVLRAKAWQGQVRAARFPRLEALSFVATSLQADLEDENGVRSRRDAYAEFALDQLSAAFGGRIQAVLPLYTFGKIDDRAAAARASERAGRAQVQMTAAEAVREAAELYETHLFTLDALRFVDEVEYIAEKSLEETALGLESGAADVSEQDKLRIESALGLARLIRSQAEAGRRQTLAGLRAYLSLPEAVAIRFPDPYLNPVSAEITSLERLIEQAKVHRPEFVALVAGIEAYEKLSRAERAAYYPDVFLLGFVSGAYTPGRDFVTSRYVLDPLGHFLPGALVGARWQLDWDGAGHRADEVRADAVRLKGLLAWAKQGIPAQVVRAYEDLRRARRDLDTTRASLPKAKRWVVRASADYGIGLSDARGLTDAVEAYVTMKSAALDATRRLNIALAALAQATGTLVPVDAGGVYH